MAPQEFLLDALQKLDTLASKLSNVNRGVTVQEPVYLAGQHLVSLVYDNKIADMSPVSSPPKQSSAVPNADALVEMETLISSAKQLVGNIQTCAEHQALITNNVLDLSRLDAGKVEPTFDVMDVQALGRQTVEMMSSKAQHKHIKLSMTKGGSSPLYLKGDATRLRQVLLNLVSNAIKVGLHCCCNILQLIDHLVHS